MKRTEANRHMRNLKLCGGIVLGLAMFICLRNIECEKVMPNVANDAKQGLSVDLKIDESAYGLRDSVVLHVTLRNLSESPIYVYKSLHKGDLAGLSIWVRDAVTGADIPKQFIADALPPPPQSRDAFVEIAPHHDYAVDTSYTIRELNIATKGTYALRAEYKSPIPRNMNFGLPVWSRERGGIRSNSVTITIAR